jgi:hypothetical protein
LAIFERTLGSQYEKTIAARIMLAGNQRGVRYFGDVRRPLGFGGGRRLHRGDAVLLHVPARNGKVDSDVVRSRKANYQQIKQNIRATRTLVSSSTSS